MILISLILVVVSALSLLVGALRSDDLTLIYVSIAAALAAGVFLLLGVLQGNRRRKPIKAAKPIGSTDEAPSATWQGAGWGGAGDQAADVGLSRDDDAAQSAVQSASGAPAPAAFAPPAAAAGPSAPAPAVPSAPAPGGQSAPGQSAPGQSAPGQSAPGQSAPGQSAPAGQPAPAPGWAPPPPPAAPPPASPPAGQAAPRPPSGGAPPPPPPAQ